MTIKTAKDAKALFERSSISVETILEYVEDSARENRRYVAFEGWPSDAVIKELRQRGFKVDTSDVLIPDTKVSW